tara:strand:+ start:838 stop:1170 length:333 start_codon:yes stop_codon:yes gene_type:complete
MPSDIAKQIVDQIFAGDKARAIETTSDAIGAVTYDAVQHAKQQFAQQMGFGLDQTAQGVADELEGQLPDGTDTEYTDVDIDQRQPHEAPAAEYSETEDNTEEEPTDETDS